MLYINRHTLAHFGAYKRSVDLQFVSQAHPIKQLLCLLPEVDVHPVLQLFAHTKRKETLKAVR